jgi:hypothetical protein
MLEVNLEPNYHILDLYIEFLEDKWDYYWRLLNNFEKI